MPSTTEFKRLAIRRFEQINPDVCFMIEWGFTSDGFVPDRVGNGSTMYGNFMATAEGHRPRRVMATMAHGAVDITLR